MIDLGDIHPLTGFLRNHKAHLARLRETGRPEVLTVNGRASVVVQDAAAYQRLLTLLEEVETARMLRARLESMEAGEAGVPAEQVLAEIRERLRPKL